MKVLKLLMAIGAFALAGLLVPRLLGEIATAESAYGYGRATGAMAVVALAAAVGIGFLRSAFAEDLLKDKGGGSSVGTLVMLVIIGGGAGYLFYTGEKPADVLKKLSEFKDLRGSVASTPTRDFATLDDAQREAVRRFPAVAIGGSPENQEYVARYKRYQKEQPEYFKTTDWPLRLAEEVSGKR